MVGYAKRWRGARHRRSRIRPLAASVLVLVHVPGCGARELPPYAQAHVTVSIDAAVPTVISRVRLDVFAADGRWLDFRETPVQSASEPISFTVFSSRTGSERRVRLRLRGYRDAAVRDYRGERFLPLPPPSASPGATPLEPPITNEPRLLRDGLDETPSAEPLPESAIDRLTWLTLTDGTVRDAAVVLRIACAGTMADLRNDQTCVDARGSLSATPEGQREVRGVSPWERRLEADRQLLPSPRPRGTAPDGTPLFDEEILVPGGPFVLGSRAEAARGQFLNALTFATPERVFVAPPLLIDRYEVTVGRYRDMRRRGFVAPDEPSINDSSGFNESTPLNVGLCTWSTRPMAGVAGRETMPLTCITHASARAFCAFQGAALATEAQWEFVAAAASRNSKTSFPWGSEEVSCADAVFGRARSPATGGVTPCGRSAVALGPLPVDAGPRDETPLGVHGLGGNVAEWVRGDYQPYGAACWARADVYDPVCEDPTSMFLPVRGNSWTFEEPTISALRDARVQRALVGSPDLGFRCVRQK